MAKMWGIFIEQVSIGTAMIHYMWFTWKNLNVHKIYIYCQETIYGRNQTLYHWTTHHNNYSNHVLNKKNVKVSLKLSKRIFFFTGHPIFFLLSFGIHKRPQTNCHPTTLFILSSNAMSYSHFEKKRNIFEVEFLLEKSVYQRIRGYTSFRQCLW